METNGRVELTGDWAPYVHIVCKRPFTKGGERKFENGLKGGGNKIFVLKGVNIKKG